MILPLDDLERLCTHAVASRTSIDVPTLCRATLILEATGRLGYQSEGHLSGCHDVISEALQQSAPFLPGEKACESVADSVFLQLHAVDALSLRLGKAAARTSAPADLVSLVSAFDWRNCVLAAASTRCALLAAISAAESAMDETLSSEVGQALRWLKENSGPAYLTPDRSGDASQALIATSFLKHK